MSWQTLLIAACYVLIVNGLACMAMVQDKMAAENGLRRTPEATLLQLALIGGSIGTVLAQRTIRHKTRKEPFRSQLVCIVLLQIMLLTALRVTLVVTGSPAALWDSIGSMVRQMAAGM